MIDRTPQNDRPPLQPTTKTIALPTTKTIALLATKRSPLTITNRSHSSLSKKRSHFSPPIDRTQPTPKHRTHKPIKKTASHLFQGVHEVSLQENRPLKFRSGRYDLYFIMSTNGDNIYILVIKAIN